MPFNAPLQQYLPFTVLKLKDDGRGIPFQHVLQQYLPFTVLKPALVDNTIKGLDLRCNSTYRLRYWNFSISYLIKKYL